MKANIPKSWHSLPKAERDVIVNYCREEATKQINDEEAELQIIWIKLCCILLHQSFGFGESRLYQFIGAWKRIYHTNARLGNRAAQTEYLDAQMKKLFPKSGFPVDFVEKLKED